MRLLMPQSGSRDFWGAELPATSGESEGNGLQAGGAMPVAFPVALNVRFGPP